MCSFAFESNKQKIWIFGQKLKRFRNLNGWKNKVPHATI
jgi:hypothetical protein